MTPKEAALRDYQAGDFSPDAPCTFSHEQKAEYYREFERLIELESTREAEELMAGV